MRAVALLSAVKEVTGQNRFLDGFPATGQVLCGFNGRRSLVTQSRVKILASLVLCCKTQSTSFDY